MADVQIRFRAQGSEAKREINQLTKEIRELHRGMAQTQRTSTEASQAVDRLGDEARQTAADVDKLGDELEQAGRGTSGFSRGVGGAGREAGVARKAMGVLGSVARDTLSDSIDALRLTSEAADAALGSMNRVGEAVRDADFRRIRDTTIQLQNLSQDAQAAARESEFLNASFSALDRLSGRQEQDQETERTEREAARETAQELREMASAIDGVIGELARFEGDIGSLTTKIGQFDIAGLASGNPLSIATLPFQLHDAFTFDQRHADARLPALDRANREAFERGEFGIPTDLLAFGRGHLSRATGFTDDPHLRALLEGLDPQIGKTTLDEVATIPDRMIETIQSYTDGVLEGLREELNQAQFNLDFAKQSGGDVQGALQRVIQANTALYQQQIDSYTLQRRATGRAIGNIEELNRTLNALNNESRLALEAVPSSQRFNLRRTIADRHARGAIDLASGRENTEAIARAQYGTEAYAAEVAAATPAESIAPVIESVNAGIAIINAAILSIETRIDQSKDPEEIARRLSQVPDLIRQKYEMLRKALEARFGAGEITESVFNAALSELQSTEAREIERHSDAVLANTLRIIDEDAQRLNASMTALETQIDQSNDPAAIARLLDQVPALITEKYRLLRKALDEKYVAGEMSVDVYNTSLTAIHNSKASETERHADAVLANTFSAIEDDVALIDANIEALQFSVEHSDDPQAIAGFLEALRILIADKYSRLRERLDERLAAAEISQTAFDAAILGLTTAENRARAGIDTQALNAISAEAQAQVTFINGSIENLRLSLALTDAPEEIQQMLDAIQVLTAARFSALRDELETLKDTLTDDPYQQALEGLNLSEQLALSNLDTEKFEAISAAAEKQVTAINTDIENLRLSLELTDNPTERQQILDAIRILTVARFTVLREELENIKDSLDPEAYNRAVRGINLGEQVGLSNIDTEKFDEISAAAMRHVEAINATIENLRVALQLTEDAVETQQILEAIQILTASRFDVLIQELHDIRDTLSDEDFNRALTGLELGQQVARANIDTEKFGALSAAAQKQVDFIEGAIDNLELALQLTDDPAEMQRIIASIRILTGKRFDRRIQALKDLRASFESDAEFNQALEGLELGKAVALKGIEDRAIGVTLTQIGEQMGGVDFALTQLFAELDSETTRVGVTDAIARLRTAILNKHALLRQKISESADTEEEKARQMRAVDFQEGEALEQLGQRGLGQLDSLVDTAQFLLDNATEAEFASRREALVTAINTFYDERIAFINGLDVSDTDRENMLAVADIQRNIALHAIPQMSESVTERLKLEQDLQDEIQDLRDEQVENEADRQAKITELHEDEARRREKIEEDHQRRLEDIRNAASESALDRRIELERDIDDLLRESGVGISGEQHGRLISGLQSGFGVDTLLDQLGINLDRDTRSRLGDINREFQYDSDDARRQLFFDQQNAAIRQQRAQADLTRRTAARETDINAQAEATATAIQTALEPLLNQEEPSPTAELARENTEKASQNIETERQNLQKAGENLQTESETAQKASENAVMYSDIATRLSGITETWETHLTAEATLLEMQERLQADEAANIANFATAIEGFNEISEGFAEVTSSLQDFATGLSGLNDRLEAFHVPRVPELLHVDLVNINAQSVSVAGGGFGGGGFGDGEPRPQRVEVEVTQHPPSDNFLLAQRNRTTQLEAATLI